MTAAQQALPIARDVAVTVEWKRWGHARAMATTCLHCRVVKQCRGKIRRRMICIDCFAEGKR